MDHQMIDQNVDEMKKNLLACEKYLDALKAGCRRDTKFNTLLDAAMQQIEMSCIEMRRLCETVRPQISMEFQKPVTFFHKEIYGNVELTENGWLMIRLNALLPHCKNVGNTQYITDTVIRLLHGFEKGGGKIPFFEKAFLAITEHSTEDRCSVFDHDNKGFKAVINALKGRLFSDDNQFELSLGMFTVSDEDVCCKIYVMPYEDASEFLYLMQQELL